VTKLYSFWVSNYMESAVRVLYGSEVTWKIKQLEVEGARAGCRNANC